MFNNYSIVYCRPFLSAYSNAQCYNQAPGHCRCVRCQQCPVLPSSCPVMAPLLPQHVIQPPQTYGCVSSALPATELQLRYASCSFPSAEVLLERPVSSSSWYPMDSAEGRAETEPRNTGHCLEDHNPLFAVAVPSNGSRTPDPCATAKEIDATAPAYRSQIGNRQPRKDRLSFTMEQLRDLEQSFARKKYLCFTDREELAEKIGVSEAQVKTWYQNRRTKWKRNYKLCDLVTA